MPTSRKSNERDRQRGLELARLRRAKGFSQEQLAEMLQVSPHQVRKYERGENRMNVNVYEDALAILREGDVQQGFAESHASYEAPSSLKSEIQIALDLMIRGIAQLREAVGLLQNLANRL
jgi:transcriptional regulator with XRE-family HTH domain